MKRQLSRDVVLELLLSEIPRLVEAEWAENGSPLLLSQLGARLPEAAKTIVRTENVGLKRLIEKELAGTLRFIPLVAQGGGIAPRAQTEGLTDSEIEKRYQSAHAVPKYELDVFNAFRRRLLPNKRRFLKLEAGRLPLVIEIDEDGEVPAGAFEILTEDLPPVPEGANVAERKATDQSIRKWSEKHRIEIKQLRYVPRLRTGGMSSQARPQGLPTRKIEQGFDGLRAALEVFTDAELARIQIPGDVVLSLLKRLDVR